MTKSAKPRVLIVEDEWLVATFVEDAIASAGFEIVGPVATVEAALNLLRDERITVAVLDVGLGPSKKSFPIASQLYARGIPFLFMSGYVKEQIPLEFRDTQLLVKPCDRVNLQAHVQALISTGADFRHRPTRNGIKAATNAGAGAPRQDA